MSSITTMKQRRLTKASATVNERRAAFRKLTQLRRRVKGFTLDEILAILHESRKR